MTPKQILVAHIESHHGGFNPSRGARLHGKPSRGWTMLELGHWHASRHHQSWTNHRHEGPNLGPGDRPPGWRTGKDVVER